MKIDLEEIRKLMHRREQINSIPLNEIEWFENGKRVRIYKQAVKDFELTGLNNIDFITSEYYLRIYD